MAFEDLLIEYGLVQFGRFADENGDFAPFKLHLDWIPSYPDVLEAAAFEVQKHFRVHGKSIHQFERILCPVDALPVAALVSAETGIPVVYSRGFGEPIVHDLVGAYDINHPTLLLTNAHPSPGVSFEKLRQSADRVGLRVAFTLSLVHIGFGNNIHGGQSGSVADIYWLAYTAAGQGYIPDAITEKVLRWKLKRRDLSHPNPSGGA